MKRVRLAMVGAGKMALWHLRAYAHIPHVEIVAIANPVSSRGQALARAFNIPHSYSDTHEMLQREEIDAVDVCVPTGLHRDIVCEALDRGLHVYCEKPLGASVEQVIAIQHANRGRVVFNGFNLRFCPEYIRLGKLISSGALGEVRLLLMTRTTRERADSYMFQQGLNAGILSEFSIHFIDLLAAWGFDAPQRVTTVGSRMFDHHDAPDTVAMNLTFPSGAMAHIVNSFGVPGICPEFTIAGTRRVAHLRYGKVIVEDQPAKWSIPQLLWQSLRRGCVLPWRLFYNPFSGSCRHFIECIVKGEPTSCNEASAGRALSVAAAATVSYREQRAVAIDLAWPPPPAPSPHKHDEHATSP